MHFREIAGYLTRGKFLVWVDDKVSADLTPEYLYVSGEDMTAEEIEAMLEKMPASAEEKERLLGEFRIYRKEMEKQ